MTRRSRNATPYLLAMVLAVVGGCHGETPVGPPPPGPPPGKMPRGSIGPVEIQEPAIRFVDTARESGMDFVYRNGDEANVSAMPEILGGGVAVWDFDLDGSCDAFVPGGGRIRIDGSRVFHPAELFRQTGPRQFTPVARWAGLAEPGLFAHGVVADDYDSDGFPDLLVTGYGGLRLYRNQGDGTFEETAGPAGLVPPAVVTGEEWATGAAWGDFNRDGHLDLYVARFIHWSPENHPVCPGRGDDVREYCDPLDFTPQPDSLFLSHGDGTFVEAADGWQVLGSGRGLGVVAADVDLDGDLDLYVANFGTPNFLYRNEGGQQFREIGQSSGAGLSREGFPEHSAGVDAADLDRDGYPDLWAVNGDREVAAFYRNVGRDLFYHASHIWGVAGLGSTYSGWGTVIADLDADQDLDIVVASGHRLKAPVRQIRRQNMVVLENHQGHRVSNIAPQMRGFCQQSHSARGLAAGDLDNDGDIDLLVSRLNEPLALLDNRTRTPHRALQLRLIGVRSARSATGARVEVVTNRHDQLLLVRSGGGFLSTHDPRIHIGLGDDSRAESIRITWPSGTTQVLRDVVPGATHVVVEPVESEPRPAAPITPAAVPDPGP